MSQIDEALACFAAGANCAQAVFATYGPAAGLDRDTCLRLASGFGGGMGRCGQACGAVTGALMALNLHVGYTDPADRAGKDRSYGLVCEFIARFTARHGSVNCTALLGTDLGTPEGLEYARAQNTHATVCPAFVRSAAELLEELLAQP